MGRERDRSEPRYPLRVLVKLSDDEPPIAAPTPLERFASVPDALRERCPGLELEPGLTTVTPEQVKELEARARRRVPEGPHTSLESFAYVRVPEGVGAEELVALFLTWRAVEGAWLQPQVADPPQPQEYLQNGQTGLGVTGPGGVSGLPGGQGDGVRFVDIEHGWSLNPLHPDLPQLANVPVYGQNRSHRDHGIHTLGVVAAQAVGGAAVGIAPRVSIAGLVGDWRRQGATRPDLADAITFATTLLRHGDVLLVEAQADLPLPNGRVVEDLPAEVDAQVRANIRKAVNAGIVVIEPAGDGDHDLDAVTDTGLPGGVRLFPNPPGGSDSGAVMVGATRNPVPGAAQTGWAGTCTGARVDCRCPGENVYTPTVNGNYTPAFGGTSAAAAIAAGLAILIQSRSIQRHGAPKDPEEVRRLLRPPHLENPAPNAWPDLSSIDKRL